MENSRLFAPVVEPDLVGNFYALVSGERLDRQGASSRAAWEMERLAALGGWQAGETLGSEAALRERFRIGRETLREAIRIVESRGAMRMQRGRSGGLMLLRPTIERPAASLAAYLRAIGMTSEQFARSVRGLDQLLAWQLARRTTSLPARMPDEELRHWLVRASGRQTYVIYISALDKLADQDATAQVPPAGIYAAIERRNADEIFSLLDRIPFVRSEDPASCADGARHPRANALAMEMIERSRKCGAPDLGNEASLCDEYDMSRSLVRQALRVLQDLDMIEVRLGRGGGYTLKKPSPIGIIRQFFVWLAARNCDPFALNELMWDLNSANLRSAGEKLAAMPPAERHAHCDRIDRFIGSSPAGPARFICLQQQLAGLADCPMIDTLARCVVSYQARSYGDLFEEDSCPEFEAMEHLIVAALRRGDLDAAERTLRKLQLQGEELAMETLGLRTAAE